jgi:polyisoprenoid-binding protein YceI
MRYIFYSVLLIFSLQTVFAVEFQVDKSQKNIVKFISDAPMEDFEGVTDKIDGYLFYEEGNLLQSSEMYFEVDLNSLDTGIGLRNTHMRENYLETDKFPFTHFTGKLIKAVKKAGNIYQVSAQGKMFIHGVEQEITVDGTMNPLTDGYQVQASFITPLTDYQIKVPRIMFFKIDENMTVEVDFFLKKVEDK